MKQADIIRSTGESLDQLTSKGISYSQEKGLDRIMISNSCNAKRKLVIEGKEFARANSFDSQKFSILVHHDQKSGTASVNTDSEALLFSAIDNAASMASFSVADKNLTLADKETAGDSVELDFLFDSDLAEMEFETIKEDMQEILEVLTKDEKMALESLEMEVDVSREALFNSLGVAKVETQTTIMWSWMGMGKEGDIVSGFDYDYNFSFAKNGYKQRALEEARLFPERLIAALHPKKCPSYKGLVLLSPRAVGELITDTIIYHMSGRSVMDQKSRWANSIGESIASAALNIKDLPHEAYFMGATSFDQDGLATKPLSLVEEGVLQTHFINCYTGKVLNQKPTATSGGPFGICVGAGKDSLADLKSARGDMLLMDRFSGNVDPLTGDFSGVAKNSRLLKAGNDAGAVSETMVAGNIFQVLNQIAGVSQNVMNVSGTYQSPWILIDGISVTGE